MAAPCRRMASRSLLQFLSGFRRTAAGKPGLRVSFGTSACRTTPQTKAVPDRGGSPWTLMAAVCLQRLPVISADCSPIERQFKEMLQQVCFRIMFTMHTV
uniref:Large ribosomal subunit protein mL46 N-terminal domain-containing protein n=1 Tax=Labrus bergylta TaxID=56723 RepID=A0A3Q3GCE6_9LABR